VIAGSRRDANAKESATGCVGYGRHTYTAFEALVEERRGFYSYCPHTQELFLWLQRKNRLDPCAAAMRSRS
jgi:hypothetical protein